MFLTERKFESRVNELSKYRYREMVSINSFKSYVDDGSIARFPKDNETDIEEIQLGDNWQGRDLYRWLKCTVTLPEVKEGMKLVGKFSFGKTGGGTNSGFESMLFVNGKPFQGVDSNHEEVLFDPSLAGQTVDLDFRMWTGLEGGGVQQIQHYKLDVAEVGLLDEKIDSLYFTSLAMYQTIMEIPDADPNRHVLIKILDETLHIIDWSVPGSDSFFRSCYESEEHITSSVSQLEKHSQNNIYCVGHTHIDVAWLWRLKHTREKIARSFSTVLNLMNNYPDYTFMQSQPQLYEYIKEDYPEVYEKMKERIKEGRWEVEGSMWLEADCNIPSGESLVRQILVGKNFLKREFDKDCEVLWLPDVFGYSWALPQILTKSGIKSFVTTKISWNQYNRMPHDTFQWKGIDGSKVLTHFITTPEPWNGPDSWFYTYNGFISAKTINGAWKAYRNKDVNTDLLVSYGYGDGGGGVNREMLEMRRHLDKMPGMPNVKPGNTGEFFEKLHDTVEKTARYVHEWDGELYLEYHRGTYTSQASIKKHNRKLELALRNLEFLCTKQALENGWNSYPEEDLLVMWKTVLRNQFHDIIPGSSIKEVYEDAEVEYAETWDTYNKYLREFRESFDTNQNAKYTLINTSTKKNGHHVFIPFDDMNSKNGVFRLENGTVLESQRAQDGHFLLVNELPQFGSSVISFEANDEANIENTTAFTYFDNQLETPFYKIRWNKNGQIETIFDKEAQRNVLAENERGNVLQVFEDKPLAHDAWDIDLFYQQKIKEVRDVDSVELIENGALRAVVRFSWTYQSSIISQDVIFYINSKRIDFNSTVDWQERNELLKVSFPVDIRTTEATYDIQYGNVKRPNHWNTSWDMAKFETVGHMWADLSESGYGVSILNDCKYGHDIKGNNLRLTLLKSASHPDPLADQGVHTFTYSLYPHIGDWREGGTHEAAWELNTPIVVLNGADKSSSKSLFNFNSDLIHVDAIKKCENCDGVIVRFHEFTGGRGNVEITSDYPIQTWVETDLMENMIDEVQVSEKISLKISPYEIKTILVKF